MTEANAQAISIDEAVGMLLQAPEKDKPEDAPEADEADADEAEVVEPEEAEEGQSEEGEADDDEDPPEDDDPEIEWENSSGKIKAKLSELQAGYMRQKDYTRKTTEAAELRRQAEADRKAVQEKQAQLEDYLAQWAVQAPQEPDWVTLAQQVPPQEFNLFRVQWEQQQRRASEAAQMYQKLRKEETEKLRQEGAAKLREALPELADPDKGPTVANGILEAASHLGIAKEELDSIYDPRVYVALHLASQALRGQRQAAEKKSVAEKKVAKPQPALQASAKTTKRDRQETWRQQQMAKLRKTGSMEDAIPLLFVKK